MMIVPERGWERLIKVLHHRQGTVMLLGATDSGKTTLARYIVESLVTRRLTTALIDADVGQSGLGLPGTICMKVFRNQKDVADYRFAKMTFLGFTNPVRVIRLLVTMTGRMTGIGQRRAEITVVDTTGLISGEPGGALKMAKIAAVRPDHIFAIQREDELEHILSRIGDGRVYRLQPSRAAKKRSASVRAAHRKRKLEKYFRELHQFACMLDSSAVPFFSQGRKFRHGERELLPGTIIGLNRNDYTIALGVLEATTDTAVFFRSPLRSLKGINRVICGDMSMP
jgi:polynucleotide 5'-hydroxyl-kinase GRC3/NOL9